MIPRISELISLICGRRRIQYHIVEMQRCRIIYIALILLVTVTGSYSAPSYSKEDLINTFKECCFESENTKLLIFKEPITVMLYDMSGLEDFQIDSIRSTIEILKYKTGIDIYFKNAAKEAYSGGSVIFLITLPNDRSSISSQGLHDAENIYFIFREKLKDKVSFQAILDNIYTKGHAFSAISIYSSDTRLGSLFLIQLPVGNTYSDESAELGILASLGYNKDLKPIGGTIFSLSEKKYAITDLDFSILRILYGNKNTQSITFDQVKEYIK